jgi:hypothetical protein
MPAGVIEDWQAFVEAVRVARLSRGQRGQVRPQEERQLFRDLLRRYGKLIVLVHDIEGETIGDQADATCQLSRHLVDDRVERTLELVMVSGRHTGDTAHPFTLRQGTFRSFPRFSRDAALWGGTHAEEDPAPEEAMMWPGSRAFATAFGRLPTYSMSLIEVDPEVPYEVSLMLTIPFVVSTFRTGGRISVAPPPMVPPADLHRRLIAGLPPAVLELAGPRILEQIRFLSHIDQSVNNPDLGKILIPLREHTAAGGMRWAVPDERGPGQSNRWDDSLTTRFPAFTDWTNENPTGAPNAMVVHVDGILAAAREIGAGYTAESFSTLAQRDHSKYPMHQMLVSQRDDPLVSRLKPLLAVHLRLRTRGGHYFLQGVRPWTENYALLPSARDARLTDPPYSLVGVE